MSLNYAMLNNVHPASRLRGLALEKAPMRRKEALYKATVHVAHPLAGITDRPAALRCMLEISP
jgi:hypothetical protein